jgi:DNA-binding transcriptional ArsR family regulator
MDDPHELESVAACLEALGNETRLAIYRLLVKAGPDGLAVGEVQAALRVPASTLTHHLSRLVWVGLVRQERHGRRLICSADFEGLDQMMDFLQRECCQGARESWPAGDRAAQG